MPADKSHFPYSCKCLQYTIMKYRQLAYPLLPILQNGHKVQNDARVFLIEHYIKCPNFEITHVSIL